MNNNVGTDYQQAIQAPLDAATQNWKDRTQNCKRNRIIQTVALAALALFCLGLLAVNIALPFMIPMTAIIAISFVVTMGLSIFSIGFFIERLCDKKDHYEKPVRAQEIVDSLRNDELSGYYDQWSHLNVENLAKYGFIQDNQEIKDEFKRLLKRTRDAFISIGPFTYGALGHRYRNWAVLKTLEPDWIAFRNTHIIPHLPSPQNLLG